MTHTRLRFSILALLIGCVGCTHMNVVQPPSTAVPNQARDQIGRLAIRGPYAPSIEVSGDAIARRGDVVGEKAGEAGLGSIATGVQLGAESQNPLGFVFFSALGIVVAPAAAVGGAIYGGAISDTDEDIEASVPVLREALRSTPMFMEAQLLADMESAEGLTGVRWAHVPVTESDAALAARGFDAVLDVRMTRIDTMISEDQAQVSLRTSNRATLTDLDDSGVLAVRDYERFTDERKLSRWADDDAAQMLATLSETFDLIGNELIDDFFVEPTIRVDGLEPVARDAFGRGRIDSLKPLLLWKANDASQSIPEDYPIEYELVLYTGSKAPDEGIRLQRDRYVPPELLKTCSRYRWKIRAHYQSFGKPVTSPWSPEYRFGTPCD